MRGRISSLGWMRFSGAILIALVMAGGFFPRANLWGMHFLAFLPAVVAVILLAVSAMLLAPLGKQAIGWIRRAQAQRVPIGIWIILSFAIFVILRVQEPLLGDGQALLRHLEAIGRLEARGFGYVDKGQARWAEVLETRLHETVFRAAAGFHPPVPADFSPTEDEQDVWTERMWFFETARWTYVLLSAAAGALLCWMLVQFARRMLPPRGRAVFLLSVLGSGAVLIFFGYVEDYAWATMGTAGCILAAIEDAANPHRWPWRTAVWWGVALGMHLMTLFLLPLVLYLFLARWIPDVRQGCYARWTSWSVWLLLLLAVVGISGLAPASMRKYVLPLTGVAAYQGYPLLSLGHAADLGNLLVLAVPVIPLALSIRYWRKRQTESLRALEIACAGGIGFLLLFDPRLGASRDWDLCSVALWPMILSGAWILASQPWGSRRDTLLAGLTAGVLLIPVPMVMVHAGAKSEVARLEAVLVHDPARSAFGWENLAAYFRRADERERAVEALQHSVAVDPNPHYALNLASELRRAGRLDEAEPIYLSAAEKRPDYVKNLLFLAQSYARRGDSGKARNVVRKMNELEPGNPIYTRLLFQLDSLAGDSVSEQD